MKKIFDSTKALLVIGILIFASFFLLPCFNLQEVVDAAEPTSNRLKIVNDCLILDDTVLMCRFVPVVGGVILSGNRDSTNITSDTVNDRIEILHMKNKYVHSFIIGEIPVSRRLWAFVEHGLVPENNNIHKWKYIYEDSLKSKEWDKFIEKLNEMTGRKFRLPTNEEWEYAARGGLKSRNYRYAGSNDINEVAFYKDNWKIFFPPEGGVKSPNELGLYDMSGSVWELTSTMLLDADTQLRMYPDIEEYFGDTRVVRGGSYLSPKEECALDYLKEGGVIYSGARLVLEY